MLRALSKMLFAAALLLAANLGPLAAPARAADEPAAGTHAAPEKQGGLFEFKPPLAIATLIVFVLLLLVLRRYAWDPLMKALHDREHYLEQTLRETEKARDEAATFLGQHKALIDQGAAQVRAMLDEARVQAQAIKDDMVKQAQQEAESVRQRAEREIGSARDQAILELWDRAADLAVSVAGKVLPRELREDDHRRLIEGALAELPQAPVGSGNGQGARA
jgi:F-type H+-transporting ATPase subunit b